MKTLHYSIILVVTLFIVSLENPVYTYATCITVNGTQECASSQPILNSIKFDKLRYENSDKPIITITGVPYSPVHLEIGNQSGNIVFSHNAEILTTGTINYTLDISSYKLGVYSAIASNSANKVTARFMIGHMLSGPPIALSVLKNTHYIPGDSITILGVEGHDEIIQLSLVDPNGNVVKSVQTNTDNTGQFSSNDLKIPINAISGIWQINATHGTSYSSLEIKVNSTAFIDMIKNNTNTTVSTHDDRGSIVMIPVESPLKQFKSGIDPKNVKCSNDLTLVIKSEDGSPACVKSDTSKILIEHGWAKPV
ncbi:MAG: hypothetical protein ACYC6W_01390 [Nitrosotalea sp.]